MSDTVKTKQKTTKTISDVSAKQPSAWKKAFMVVFLSFMIFGLLIATGFWGYEKAYAEKIYPGVKIGEYEAGGQTPAEIKALVDSLVASVKSEKLSIVANDKTIAPTLDEIGVSFNSNDIIDEAYKIGRNKSPFQRFWEDLKTIVLSKEIILTPSINEAKFNAYLKQNTTTVEVAKNATFRIENNDVITVLSEAGSKVNINKFREDLVSNIQNHKINQPIVLQTTAIPPEINEDQISIIKPKVEGMISQPIVLTYNNKNYSASAETIAGWIIIKSLGSGNLDVQLSDDNIKSFIADCASKIDQKPIDKKINAKTNEVIEEGRDGLRVNQDKVLSNIKAALNNSNPTEANHIIAIDVVETPRDEKKIEQNDIDQNGGTPGLYPGKYIEINLSEQKLYAYEGTNLVGAYIVSTGQWSTPTPVGVRYIESKSDRAYSAKYDLYMPYWNSIGGGYGIHELPEWANGYKEGEDHLGTPVSHGCIRLGVGSAEFIYNWAPTGTPVDIHQ